MTVNLKFENKYSLHTNETFQCPLISLNYPNQNCIIIIYIFTFLIQLRTEKSVTLMIYSNSFVLSELSCIIKRRKGSKWVRIRGSNRLARTASNCIFILYFWKALSSLYVSIQAITFLAVQSVRGTLYASDVNLRYSKWKCLAICMEKHKRVYYVVFVWNSNMFKLQHWCTLTPSLSVWWNTSIDDCNAVWFLRQSVGKFDMSVLFTKYCVIISTS